MIDVFSEFKKLNKNACLLLIGDGIDREKIQERVHELDLDKDVMMLGQRNDVSDIIQAFDVFILTSIFEGFPVVLVEAQAAGIPCLISDSITDEVKITDLVEKLSISDNPAIWAKALLKQTQRKKKSMSEELINQGFDIKHESKKLESFYLSRLEA